MSEVLNNLKSIIGRQEGLKCTMYDTYLEVVNDFNIAYKLRDKPKGIHVERRGIGLTTRRLIYNYDDPKMLPKVLNKLNEFNRKYKNESVANILIDMIGLERDYVTDKFYLNGFLIKLSSDGMISYSKYKEKHDLINVDYDEIDVTYINNEIIPLIKSIFN